MPLFNKIRQSRRGNDGVSTRAKKRNLRETLPPVITIIAPRIDVGDAVVGGFPIRVAPLRGKFSSPLCMELTADNVDYLQTVTAHEMRVNPRASRPNDHRHVLHVSRASRDTKRAHGFCAECSRMGGNGPRSSQTNATRPWLRLRQWPLNLLSASHS